MGRLHFLETTIISLKAAQWDSQAKLSALEGELLTQLEQFRKSESKISFLQTTIKDLDAHATRLLTQLSEACKEVTLA